MMHIMKTTPFILTVMLTVVCCTKTAAQGFQRESFPEGSYSPVTNINRGSYPRVLADNRVMFRVNAPQAQQVQIDLCGSRNRDCLHHTSSLATSVQKRPGTQRAYQAATL